MTAPRPRPEARPDGPDSALERLLVLADTWKLSPTSERTATTEELISGFVALADGLASGEVALPQQWAGATPPAPELPAGELDAEVTEAQAAVTAAEAAFAAADAALRTAQEQRHAAARVLGEARKRFYDLARTRDLSRP